MTEEEELRQLEADFLDARPIENGGDASFEKLCQRFEETVSEPTKPVEPDASTESVDTDETPEDQSLFEPVHPVSQRTFRDKKKAVTVAEKQYVKARRRMLRGDLKRIDQKLAGPLTVCARLKKVAAYQSGFPALVEMLNQTYDQICKMWSEHQKLVGDPPKTEATLKRLTELLTEAIGMREMIDEGSTIEEYARFMTEVRDSTTQIKALQAAADIYEDVREYYAQRPILRSKKMNAELILYDQQISDLEEKLTGSSLPITINLGKNPAMNSKKPSALSTHLTNLITHLTNLKQRVSEMIDLITEEENGELFYAARS